MEKTECEVATLSEMLKKYLDGQLEQRGIYGARTCSPQHDLGWHPQRTVIDSR